MQFIGGLLVYGHAPRWRSPRDSAGWRTEAQLHWTGHGHRPSSGGSVAFGVATLATAAVRMTDGIPGGGLARRKSKLT